jgi:hypothetical protein
MRMDFLTAKQLIELTGKKQKAAQRTCLTAMGINFIVRPDGSNVVTEESIMKMLGIKPNKKLSKKRTEPDFSMFDKR